MLFQKPCDDLVIQVQFSTSAAHCRGKEVTHLHVSFALRCAIDEKVRSHVTIPEAAIRQLVRSCESLRKNLIVLKHTLDKYVAITIRTEDGAPIIDVKNLPDSDAVDSIKEIITQYLNADQFSQIEAGKDLEPSKTTAAIRYVNLKELNTSVIRAVNSVLNANKLGDYIFEILKDVREAIDQAVSLNLDDIPNAYANDEILAVAVTAAVLAKIHPGEKEPPTEAHEKFSKKLKDAVKVALQQTDRQQALPRLIGE